MACNEKQIHAGVRNRDFITNWVLVFALCIRCYTIPGVDTRDRDRLGLSDLHLRPIGILAGTHFWSLITE